MSPGSRPIGKLVRPSRTIISPTTSSTLPKKTRTLPISIIKRNSIPAHDLNCIQRPTYDSLVLVLDFFTHEHENPSQPLRHPSCHDHPRCPNRQRSRDHRRAAPSSSSRERIRPRIQSRSSVSQRNPHALASPRLLLCHAW